MARLRLPLAAIGFTSTIAQIVLIREMVATCYGNELLFGLVLMAWLGALLSVVLFVPVLGIPQSCAAVALVGLAGLLALW